MPSTSAGVVTTGIPFTTRADAIASDMMVSVSPARALARPEMVTRWAGLTVVSLNPIVNGALLIWTAAGVTGAPPEDAASAPGAVARPMAAMAARLARRRGRQRIDIGISFISSGLVEAV